MSPERPVPRSAGSGTTQKTAAGSSIRRRPLCEHYAEGSEPPVCANVLLTIFQLPSIRASER